jgi:hypothetical protein
MLSISSAMINIINVTPGISSVTLGIRQRRMRRPCHFAKAKWQQYQYFRLKIAKTLKNDLAYSLVSWLAKIKHITLL